MLTKILLVASFILLAWNSFESSKNNNAMREKIENMTTHYKSIQNYLIVTESNVEKNSQALLESSKKIVKNQEYLNVILDNSKKQSLVDIKTAIDTLNKTVNTHIKSSTENQKRIVELKTTSDKILDHIKNYREGSVKKSTALPSSNKVKVPTGKNSKQTTTTKNITTESTFNKIIFEFYKTKELKDEKKMDKALEQLDKLKTEVWKSRKIENIPFEKVLSIISSIDVVKKQWSDNKIDYKLDKTEEKINQLIFKSGFCI